jgi:hypothetical protein
MTTGSLCTNLIERYLATSGLRFLRGEHRGEYFCVVDAGAGRLHVHLQVSPSFDDMLSVTVSPGRFFPGADRAWLTRFADTWNQKNRGVTAIVRGSADSERIGLVARRSQWIAEGIAVERFASFVDRTIAEAVDLFAEATVGVELDSTTQPALRDAS